MASCEKCWDDSYLIARSDFISQTEAYNILLKERESDPCSPEDQAGIDATKCPKCKRMTCHQHTKRCMNCDYSPER